MAGCSLSSAISTHLTSANLFAYSQPVSSYPSWQGEHKRSTMGIIGIEKEGLKHLYVAVDQAEAKGKSVIKAGYETLGDFATVWAILDDGATVEGQIRFRFDQDSSLAMISDAAGFDPTATDQFLRMIVSWLERVLG